MTIRKGMILLLSAIMFSSCKTNKLSGQKSSNDVQSETSCIQNVFEKIKLLTHKHSGTEYGAIQMHELSKLNVSGCPVEFRDNFTSVLKILEQTQELQHADASLRRDKNLHDPRILSALKRIMKPESGPVTTVENAEKELSIALDDHKKSMEVFLRKMAQIASKYAIEIE